MRGLGSGVGGVFSTDHASLQVVKARHDLEGYRERGVCRECVMEMGKLFGIDGGG